MRKIHRVHTHTPHYYVLAATTAAHLFRSEFWFTAMSHCSNEPLLTAVGFELENVVNELRFILIGVICWVYSTEK